MNKRFILLSILLVVLSTALFAMGVREVEPEEKAILVFSISEDEGLYTISGEDEEGNINSYTIDDKAYVTPYPMDKLNAGSVVLVKADGEGKVSELRDVTLGVYTHSYSFQFPMKPTLPRIAIWESEKPVELRDRFSYSYGYQFFLNYTTQGVTYNGKYLAKGIMDVFSTEPPLFEADVFMPLLQSYMNGEKGMMPVDNEMAPKTLEELSSLEKSSSEFDVYSYGLGYYLTAYLTMMNGVDIEAQRFAEGALTALYNIEVKMSDEEMMASIDEYAKIVQEEYNKQMAELTAANLARAEEFLAENGKKEGVITTDSGLQYIVKKACEGAQPTRENTVNVNYRLTDLDGNVLDQNDGISFGLANVVPGFAEAVAAMHVGEEITCYVHPELGYGEFGTGSIGPNTLLIFDIALNAIE